jgi:hypothetical protein
VRGRFDPFFEEDFVRCRDSGEKSFFLVRLLPRTAEERLENEEEERLAVDEVLESRERERLMERERLEERERLLDEVLRLTSDFPSFVSVLEVGVDPEGRADPTKGVAAMNRLIASKLMSLKISS